MPSTLDLNDARYSRQPTTKTTGDKRAWPNDEHGAHREFLDGVLGPVNTNSDKICIYGNHKIAVQNYRTPAAVTAR